MPPPMSFSDLQAGRLDCNRVGCDVASGRVLKVPSDPLGSREPILSRHASNERDDIRGEARLMRPSSSAAPSPPESESFAVPAEHGLGLHDEQGITPSRNEPREQDKQSALVPEKDGA